MAVSVEKRRAKQALLQMQAKQDTDKARMASLRDSINTRSAMMKAKRAQIAKMK